MLSKQNIISAVLLPFAFASTWLILQWLGTTNNSIKETDPDSFISNVIAIKMNDLGNPQDELLTPLMEHYPLNDTTAIITPHLIMYPDKGEAWHIHSNKGKSQQGIKEVTLWDNVVITQAAGPYNVATTMTTSSITIYPKAQTAQTEQPVHIQQPGGNVNSTGLKANLNTGTIDLLSQVSGNYQPNNE